MHEQEHTNEQEQTTKKRGRPLAPKALTPAERRRMEKYLVESGLQTPFPFAADLLPPAPKPKGKRTAAVKGVHHD